MASASFFLTGDDLHCAICLEVFIKPVTLPCGHDFCQNCINKFWETNNPCCCPMCKGTFESRPSLCVNTTIASMAEKLKEQLAADIAAKAYILCNHCGVKNIPAIKSCLQCLTSFCATHLEPHQTTPALKPHQLIQPVKDLESRLCKKHQKPLEYFCNNDRMFLCWDCLHGQHARLPSHASHEMVTFEVAMKTKMDEQQESLTEISRMIQQRRQNIVDFGELVQTSKTDIEQTKSDSWEIMNASIKYIQRSRNELQEVLDEKQRAVEAHAKGVVEAIEKEIEQLKQKETELLQIQSIEDCFQFVQSFHSVQIKPPLLTKDWATESIDCDNSKVVEAVNRLQLSVMKEVHVLCDPDLPEIQLRSVNVVLDPATAHPCLSVSADGKQVTYRLRQLNLDRQCSVLAKEGFQAGICYYEVQVKGKTEWVLGVARESIKRQGDTSLNPQNGYWTIWLRNGNEYTANEETSVVLNLRKKPQKIGVLVRYERGQVTFYDVEESVEIYAFTGCTFTEKLFPFFSPCRDSAPLIITPVIAKERDPSWSSVYDDGYDDYYDDH